MEYFPNLILLSAFLGLSVGALQARAKSLMWLWPVGLLLLVAGTLAMSRIAFTANDATERLWLLYVDLPDTARAVEGIRLPLIVIFAMSALTFVPLGQYVGVRLKDFRGDSSAVVGQFARPGRLAGGGGVLHSGVLSRPASPYKRARDLRNIAGHEVWATAK